MPSMSAAAIFIAGAIGCIVGGYASRRIGSARVAIVASVTGTGIGLVALAGTPQGGWLPSVIGMALAAAVFALAWLPGAKA